MILSSYLRELSVQSNKRRNNNKELSKLVPNIDLNVSYDIKEKELILPKKELRINGP